jgi:hypothetical protein
MNDKIKKMKHKMNQVTPKAGTLKQTNEFQNALRKLIASVLMLAVLVVNPGSIMAGVKGEDSCCETPSKKMDLSKTAMLTLPSSEMVKKADREMTVNLYKSLNESKVKKFEKLFSVSDARVNALFISETTINMPATVSADERMNNEFAAENINVVSAVNADADLHDLFTAQVAGIRQSFDVTVADKQIDILFNAEHIVVPGDESFAKADFEINRNMNDEFLSKLASTH